MEPSDEADLLRSPDDLPSTATTADELLVLGDVPTVAYGYGEYVSMGGKRVSLAVRSLARSIASMAAGVIFTYMLEVSVPFFSLFFLGRMDSGNSVLMAGGALGLMLVNVTGLSVGFGLASSLDTLCSQAMGADNKMLVGLNLQRGLCLLLALCIPVITLWFNTERLMLALGQHAESSKIAGEFCRVMSLGLPGIYIAEALKKFLYSQGVVTPQSVVLCGAIPLHVAQLVLYIKVFKFSYLCIPVAVSITWTVMAASLAIYTKRSGILRDTWPGWTTQALTGWGKFLALGLPGVLMLTVEWSAFEILTLFAGMLGPDSQAAQALVSNVAMLIYMTPLGFSIATAAHTGNFLGAGSKRGAQRVASIALGMVVVTGSSMGLLVFACSSLIPRLYTDNARVIEISSQALRVVGAMHLFDSLQGTAQGSLRGGGRQLLAAVGNTIGLLLIAVPTGVLLALKTPLHITGMWVGMFIGVLLTSTSYMAVLRLQDWDALIVRARRAAAEVVLLAAPVEAPKTEAGGADASDELAELEDI